MAKITITKGRPYDLTVIVKQPGSPTPIEFTGSVSGTFYIIDKTKETQLVASPVSVIGDPKEGKLLVSLSSSETATLPSEYIRAEDGYVPNDTCRGHIGITDPGQTDPGLQNIDVIVPFIYVANIGV